MKTLIGMIFSLVIVIGVVLAIFVGVWKKHYPVLPSDPHYREIMEQRYYETHRE